MIKTLALNGKALLTNNKELGWERSNNSKLYYESLSEIVGPTNVDIDITVTELPYLVISYDFRVYEHPWYTGAGGTYFNFNNNQNNLRTRDHTVYRPSETSVFDASTDQIVNIIDASCSRISLDGRYNYFMSNTSPKTYHNHAYLINISTNFLKIFFDAVYIANTSYSTEFDILKSWGTTQESIQTPYIKNIYVYGFATEEAAINFIVN